MGVYRKVLTIFGFLALMAGAVVLVAKVENIGRAIMSFIIAALCCCLATGIIAAIISPIVDSPFTDNREESYTAGKIVLVIIFVIGMIILTPIFYNNVEF